MLPDGAPFSAAETASFGFARVISVDDTVDWLATASQVITADPDQRTAGLARSRAKLQARAFRADDTELVRMPMRSWCWRADRRPRVQLSGGGRRQMRRMLSGIPAPGLPAPGCLVHLANMAV
jgi:hypothetical protein